MSNQLINENQVKAAIGITDWRHLSKDKLMNFISILPDVDNEVAIKIIEQFPEFSKNSVEMVNIMRDVCSTALEADKIGLKDTEGKTFKGKLLNTVGGVVLGALLIGASVLGVKYLDTKNNNLLRH